MLKQGGVSLLQDKQEKLPQCLFSWWCQKHLTPVTSDVPSLAEMAAEQTQGAHGLSSQLFLSHWHPFWSDFAVDAQLNIWAKTKGGGGPLCPSSAAHGCTSIKFNVVAPGQLGKSLYLSNPEKRSWYLLVRPRGQFPRSMAGPLCIFFVALCPMEQSQQCSSSPHGPADTARSPVRRLPPIPSSSPHSNPFLLQFKVPWHFIWKIL